MAPRILPLMATGDHPVCLGQKSCHQESRTTPLLVPASVHSHCLEPRGCFFHGTPTFLMAAAYGGKSDFKIFRLLSASSARNSRPV